MAEAVEQFHFERDPNSKLLTRISVHRGEAVEDIPISESSRECCRFLAWLGKQDISVRPGTYEKLIADSEYFCQEQDLFLYCKDRGIMLSVEGLQSKEKVRLRTDANLSRSSITLTNNKAPVIDLHRLYQCMQADAGLTLGNTSLRGVSMPVFVTGVLWAKLNELLRDEDSEVRKLSSWPVERTFIYVDISEFSQCPPGHQALIINSLIATVNNKNLWSGIQEKPWGDLEAQLCIGDGYIFVFKRPWIAVNFAGYLAMLLETRIGIKQIPEFHFRIGIHTGEVYRFWDYGRWNYTGTGIINGQRVVSAIGKDQDDVVFISAETRQQILSRDDGHFLASQMTNRGIRKDKHGGRHRLYELNHVSLMGRSTE